jgi:hypothetical protein
VDLHVNNKEFVLIIPDNLVEMSVGAVKLCELFVFKILSSPEDEIVISVNERDHEVRSNSVEIRELISMLLGSKRLNEFYRQLAQIAHKGEEANQLSLNVMVSGKLNQISVKERNGLPDLQLQIMKSDGVLPA